MSPVGDTLFARALRLLARQICRRPRYFIWPQVALFGVCVLYTVRFLTFDMDQDHLVGTDQKYNRVYLQFEKAYPGGDPLAIVVESDDPERNRQFVERLGAKLSAETNLLTNVFYTQGLSQLGPKALLFVPATNLVEIHQMLVDAKPFLNQFAKATNLDSFFELVNRQFRTAKQETNAANNALIGAIPLLDRIITQATDTLSRPGQPVSPGIAALFGGGDEAQKRMYITFASNRIYIITMEPTSDDVLPAAIHRIRALMNETETEVPGLNVGLTGKPVLDYDQAQQSQYDSTVATIVALVICSLIFIYAYRETGRPLKAVVCLVVGLGYSMAFTTLTVGHLNILTITFAPILIGLAIDFGIHFITRFEEETRHRRSPEEAVEKALVFTGQGIITGALTTAGAFFAMAIPKFKGVQEMGIIAGGGLVLCLAPMMTMLPALLLRGRQNVIDHQVGMPEEKRAQIEKIWLERPALMMGLVLGFCILAGTEIHKVSFDYNLLHLQSQGLPSVEYDLKLAHCGQSILHCAIIADSLEQARQFEKEVIDLPSVANVDASDEGEPIFERLTINQSSKIKLVRQIKNDVSSLHFAPVDTNGVPLETLGATLWRTMGYLALGADAAQKQEPKVASELRGLRQDIVAFRVAMLAGDPSIVDRLSEYQIALFNDIRKTFDALKQQTVSGYLRPADLPGFMRSQFIGTDGTYQVQVWPKKDIWTHENQREFVQQLRQAVGPNYADRVTGTPVQLYEYTTLLKDSYQQAALYSLCAIIVMVLLHFRSIVCVVLSLLPVAVGSVWTVGLMGLTGISFNPANIMTLPLVIGIGVTNGIHILNRVAEERKATILSKSTGKAVLVSGLTAITGFGSLILGRHQGIRSLGIVMSMGIAACMIAGLTFLPAVINLLERFGWRLSKAEQRAEANEALASRRDSVGVREGRPGSGNAEPPPGLEEPR